MFFSIDKINARNSMGFNQKLNRALIRLIKPPDLLANTTAIRNCHENLLIV